MLIGLGHAARVGKDTCAQLLVDHHGYRRVAFADALRDFVYRTDADVRLQVNVHGWEASKVAHPSVRRTLIDVGNAARDIMGADVWIRAALKGVAPGDRVVISDVRYPNEVDAVRAAGGVAVKVTRPGFEPGKDVADQALASWKDGDWDQCIRNDGTVDGLRSQLDLLVSWREACAA